MTRDVKLPVVAFSAALLGFAMLLTLLRFSRVDIELVLECRKLFGEPGEGLHYLSEFGKYFPPTLLLLSLPWCWWRQRRPNPPGWRPWIFCVLVYLSLFVVVNFTLKPGFSRPRPIDCHEIRPEAKASFVPVFSVASDLPKHLELAPRSFPSSHAFSAFSLVALFFVLRRRFPRPALLAFLFASCLGLATGIIAMLELRHFPSDLVASYALVWLTCIAFDLLLLRPPHQAPENSPAQGCEEPG